jgi:hypothetical protein
MSLILSGTEGLSDVDGSAATPAIRGTDANTGIFFPAADTIAFAEGGAEVMRIDSAGNVGIGTASPGARLQVTNTDGEMARFRTSSGSNQPVITISASDSAATVGFATGGNASFPAMTFANGGSERMRIDSSGNVGIGTASPSGRLNLAVGASTSCVLRFTANNTGTGAGDRGRLDFYSADNSGVAYQLGYMDYDRADGTGTASYIAWANRKAGTVSESMRIDSSGNVGIGTTSPSTYGQLAVYSSSSNVEIAAVTDGASYATVRVQNSSRRYSMQIRTDQSNAWVLRDENAAANRLLVDTSGNLLFNSGYGSAATAYGCRAWISFNGTGTPAIRGSGNISSITDNGTGDYTLNFSTAMPDANYAVNLTSRITSTGIPPVVVNLLTTTTPTASLFRIVADRNGVGPVDPEYVFASVFR